MSETVDETSRLSCAHAATLCEKQFAEEPLSKEAEAALRSHLAQCRDCRRIADWMAELPVCADSHAEKRFRTGLRLAYRASMDRRAHLQYKAYRRKIAMAIVAAAAVLVAMTINRYRLSRVRPSQETVATNTVDCLPISPTETVSGVLLTYCENETPEVRIENDGDVSVLLQGGTVGLKIDPNRPHKRKVTVETPHGEVRVKGTVFTVHVDAQQSHVEVFRGVVEFVPSTHDDTSLFVKAGEGADLRRQTVYALVSPQTTSLRQILYENGRHRSVSSPASSPQDKTGPSTSRETAAQLEEGKPSTSKNAGASSAQSTSVTPTSNRRPSTVPSRKREVPSIGSLIQEAQSCLLLHDWS